MSGLSSLHVVVADDNENMRRILTAMLKGAGVRHIYPCANGYEAIIAVQRYSVDIAVVDLNMEPVNGLEFTRFMRNSELSKNPYLPIILMTGNADRSRVLKARDVGVHEVMVKPVTPKAVLGRFQSVLGKPRAFVRTSKYFGPDRRRMDVEFEGPDRRAGTDAESDAA